MSHAPAWFRARRWGWLALWVFILSAWMPTLNAWVASSRADAAWGGVCTVRDVLAAGNWDASSSSTSDSGQGQAGREHCPWCVLQHHTPALLPSTWTLTLSPATLTEQLPPLFLHAPRPLYAWSPLSARAPPLSA